MPSIFDEWTLEDARLATQLAAARVRELDSYRAFLQGDHWQDWEGWTGPRPDPKDPDAAVLREGIARGFVSRNVLGECVGRHVNGVLGRDVKWQVVPRRELAEGEAPSGDEQARADEAVELLRTWVDARKLNQEFDRLGETLLIAGEAYLRAFVAPGAVGADGLVPTADLATSLGRVYLDFPPPGAAAVWTDPRTQAKCSVYRYRETAGSRPSQIQGQQGDERAELSYLDGDQTVIRLVGGQDDEYAYRLGSRLLMADLRRKPLLNPQVVSQQKLLNKTLSQMARNGDMAGFRERVTYNARMGGNLVRDPDSGEERWVPDTLPVGASSLLRLTGYKVRDAEGNESMTMPGMDWIDPVPVGTFLEAAQSAYEAILAECNQLHYAMSADATASGESRQVAMAAYLIDLLQTKQQVDGAWSWLLETALALAAVLSGQPGRFDDLRVMAEASVDPGPISTEMIRTVIELWREGKLTLRTGLTWIGVEDVDGEIAGIQAEEAARRAMYPELGLEPEFQRDLDRQIQELEIPA